MKVLPKIIILETEEQQAEYFLDREFSYLNYTDIDDWTDNAVVIEPDDEVMYDDFIDNSLYYNVDIEEELNEYFNMTGYEVTEDDINFREWLVDRYSHIFEDWKIENLTICPMWNTVFVAKSDMIAESLENNINRLYSLGLTLINYKDNICITVNSAGHSFYTDYWIPLYKEVNKWIKEVNDKEYKEKIEREIERLKRLLNN